MSYPTPNCRFEWKINYKMPLHRGESMTELTCTEPGIGIEFGTTFQVLSENGSE